MKKSSKRFKENLKDFLIIYSSKILSLFLIVFVLNSNVKGGTPYYGTLPTNITQAEALSAYNAFKSAYFENCGSNIRVKWDDVSKTVSEGIGYGMLLAVYANDKTSFDGLYNYYKSFLNDNGLMHWQINGCSGISGQNGATDADLDVTMALVLANGKWGTSSGINYNSEAKSMIGKIKQHEVENGTYVLKPGDKWGGSDVTNISYFAIAYLREFGKFTNDASFWNGVADKCYSIIFKNLSNNNAKGGLVSDWCNANGNQGGGKSLNYGYDACRTPWRIAFDYYWNGDANAKNYLDKVNTFLNNDIGGIKNVKDGYSQNGNVIGGNHNISFVGTFACAGITSTQDIVNGYCSELKSLRSYSYFDYCFEVFGKFFMAGMITRPGDIPGTQYTINASAGTGGSISPSGAVSVASGNNQTFNIAASTGYKVSDVLVDGNSVGAITTYTFSNVTANHTIAASFVIVNSNSYTITASAGTGGTITPSGAVSVTQGASQSFTIAASSGYKISDVTVDGVSVGKVATYAFSNVTANHTIAASFAPDNNSCDLLTKYAVPRSSALPTIANSSYSHSYTLGTGGPTLSNVSSFTINWDLPNKGLWQFSMNTNNGVPGWWIDLLPKISQTFASSSPACKLTSTGISGLDGDYWVNVDGANFVMVAKSGAYALYFTSGAAPSGCPVKSAQAISQNESSITGTFSMYPNPADKNGSVSINLKIQDNARYCITDLSGKTIMFGKLTPSDNHIELGGKLNTGIYLIKVVNGNEQYNQKMIVK